VEAAFHVSGSQESFLVLRVAFIRRFAYNVPIWSKGNRGNRIPFCRCAVDPVKTPDAGKRGSGFLLRRYLMIKMRA